MKFYQITLYHEYNFDGRKLTFNGWYYSAEDVPKVEIDISSHQWYHISEYPEGKIYVKTDRVPEPALLIYIPDSIDIGDNYKIKSILDKVSEELFDKFAYWFYEDAMKFMFGYINDIIDVS